MFSEMAFSISLIVVCGLAGIRIGELIKSW